MGEMLEDEAVRSLVKALQSREQSKMRNALLELCDACDSANPCCVVRLTTSLPRLPYNITAGLPYNATAFIPYKKSQPSFHTNKRLFSGTNHSLFSHAHHCLALSQTTACAP